VPVCRCVAEEKSTRKKFSDFCTTNPGGIVLLSTFSALLFAAIRWMYPKFLKFFQCSQANQNISEATMLDNQEKEKIEKLEPKVDELDKELAKMDAPLKCLERMWKELDLEAHKKNSIVSGNRSASCAVDRRDSGETASSRPQASASISCNIVAIWTQSFANGGETASSSPQASASTSGNIVATV
jgi:hypothetical protein